MKWSSNNRACKTVWSTLMVLDQIREQQDFISTGELKINDLKFFPQDGSTDINVRAKALAMQIDNIFRLIRRATYETSSNQTDAVNALIEILKDKDKTITNLADVADDKYFFYKEGE